MDWVLFFLYWWITGMFGFWYSWEFHGVREREGEKHIAAIAFGVFVTPFFWPLVIAFYLKHKKEADILEMEEVRRKLN